MKENVIARAALILAVLSLAVNAIALSTILQQQWTIDDLESEDEVLVAVWGTNTDMDRETFNALSLQVARLEEGVETLEGRVSAIEGTIVNVVAATCTEGIVSGHSEIPFAHPRVVIGQSGFPFQHWVEIVVQEQTGTSTYLVASSTADQPNIVLDGWMGNIRSGPDHIFNPDAGYTLRVWRHPYESMPQFQEGELVFEKWFSVPSCQ